MTFFTRPTTVCLLQMLDTHLSNDSYLDTELENACCPCPALLPALADIFFVRRREENTAKMPVDEVLCLTSALRVSEQDFKNS